MPFFVYSFVTDSGEIIKDMGKYPSIDELYNDLSRLGGELYSVVALPEFIEPIYKGIVIGKPKLKDIAEFVRNVATYLESGVSVQEALEDLSETADSKAIRYASQKILKTLAEGYTFSEALEQIGFFPKIVVSMAKIGEASGNMDATLKDAADYLDRVISIRSAAKRAMIYPIFSLISILGAFAFWTVYVLPKLTDLFTSQGMQLPLATRILIGISNFMQNYWYMLFIFLIAVIVSFPFLMRIKKFRYYVHEFLWKAPIVGLIVRNSQIAFYFQYLALLTSSGVTITESLETMENAVTNDYFLKAIGGINERLRVGRSLSETIKAAGIFDRIVVRMIAVGEVTGNMDTQMKKLADMYFEKVQNLVEVIGKLIEPVILGFIGVIFIFFVLALIQPIYNMIGNIGRY